MRSPARQRDGCGGVGSGWRAPSPRSALGWLRSAPPRPAAFLAAGGRRALRPGAPAQRRGRDVYRGRQRAQRLVSGLVPRLPNHDKKSMQQNWH